LRSSNVFAFHAFALAGLGRLAGLSAARAPAPVHHGAHRAAVQGRDHSHRPCAVSWVRLGIHRSIETVVSIGPTMLFGIALVGAVDRRPCCR